MAWKLKEEFKGKSTLSMRRTLDSLKQYHIKKLSEKIRNKFFIIFLKWIHPTITYKLAKLISRSGYHETHDKSLEKKIRNALIKFFGPSIDLST